MANYTAEDFEKWLNSDKSRKAGLRGWWWVIRQTKSDKDLQASLIHGNDQGGWNFSDPEWRKGYKFGGESFDDYYQVFLKYKAEVDAEEEKNNLPFKYNLEEFLKWLEENQEHSKVKKVADKAKKLFPNKNEKDWVKSQKRFNTLATNKTFAKEMPENIKAVHAVIHLWKTEKENSLKLEESWWENNKSWIKWGSGVVIFLLVIAFIVKKFWPD